MASQRLTIAIVPGVLNTAPALYPGASLLQLPESTVVAVANGLISYVLFACLTAALKRSDVALARVETA